jgi:type II secretory pathway component GspD/PulD (secretin)
MKFGCDPSRRPVPVVLWALLLSLLVLSQGPGVRAEGSGRAWDQDLGPVTIVTNDWVDVREILPGLASNTGLGLQMTADVSGQVNVHLEEVPVRQALSALLDPVQLDYEVRQGVLVVFKAGLVSRWLKFDYPVTLREGRGELQISAGGEEGGSGGGGGGEGGGSNANKSHVTSTATMSVWPEVMSALQVIVFQGQEIESSGESEGEGTSVNLSDEQGRTLVVNPMASLIHVRAEKDRVAEVEALLAKLQASLQQQVAIEVRILEVALDEDRQTGIDWTSQPPAGNPGVESRGNLSTLDEDGDLGQEFFQFVLGTKDIDLTMRALSTSGTLRSISTPRITTLNNQKAVVRVVKEDVFYQAQVEPAIITNGVASEPVINYTAQSVSVGVILDGHSPGGFRRRHHPERPPHHQRHHRHRRQPQPGFGAHPFGTGTGHRGHCPGRPDPGHRRPPFGAHQQDPLGHSLAQGPAPAGGPFRRTADTKANIELVMLLTPTLLTDPTAIAADHDRALANVDMP